MQRSPEQQFIRKLLSENIKARRVNAREIRNCALYDLGKRSLRSIYFNIDYIMLLSTKMKNLELEFQTLMSAYLKTNEEK